jgi:ATP-binding cassette subfamily B multidrug efflux pump
MAIVILFARPFFGLLASLVGDQAIQRNISPFVRWKLHRHIMEYSIDFFNSDFSGNVASKVWQSGRSASEVIVSALQFVWSNLVFIGSTLTLLLLLDWRLCIIVITWIALFITIANIYVPKTRERSKISAASGNKLNGHMVDVYSNIQTIKLFNPKHSEEAFIKQSMEDFIIKSGHFLRTLTASKFLMLFLSSVALTSTGFVAVYLWSNKHISPGEVTLVFGLMLRLDAQLNILLNLVTGLFRSYGTYQASIDLIDKQHSSISRFNSTKLDKVCGGINFIGINFGYNKKNEVLKEFCLTIMPGEKIGIVGNSGAGKSTIANLLLRFYEADSGTIELDGQNISNIELEDLRENIGLVTQDTSLLHRSVKDNISLGRENTTLEEIRTAAKKAHALEFIESLVDSEGRTGFNAFVGERGLQLSGGQRQRICLARIFLKEPPIIILDEATSALDVRLDNDIQQVMKNIMKGKTVISISHRLSTVKNMDKIVFLHNGYAEEIGQHELLIQNGGRYASLWESQYRSPNASASSSEPPMPTMESEREGR